MRTWDKGAASTMGLICMLKICTRSTVQAVSVQNDISEMVLILAASPRLVEAKLAVPGIKPLALSSPFVHTEEQACTL